MNNKEKLSISQNGQWDLQKDNQPHPPSSPEDSAHDTIEDHGDLRRELMDLDANDKRLMLEHIREYKKHGKKWLRDKENQKAGKDN